MYVIEGSSLYHTADARVVLDMFRALVESSGLEALRSTHVYVKHRTGFYVSDMSDGAKAFHSLGCCHADFRGCVAILNNGMLRCAGLYRGKRKLCDFTQSPEA